MLGQTLLMDIEVYPNYFEVGLQDYDSGEQKVFEIDEDTDDRDELYKFLITFKGYMITFNGIHYDNVVLAYFVKNFKFLKKLSSKELALNIKTFSNSVIADDFEVIKYCKWFKHPWIDIDLFLYWAKGLRISKKISLKSLGIQLGWDEVEELPYKHDTILDKEQKEKIRRYNTRNDLGLLKAVALKMHEDIKLRRYINKQYGLPCWSMDAPKITSEYLLEKFCRKTWDQSLPFDEYLRETRKKRYQPKPWKIGDYLPPVQFKTKFFQDLLEKIKEASNEFALEYYFEKGDTAVHVSMGIGGIHILNDNEEYKSDEYTLCIDQDVTSLYPTLLDEYKLIREELRPVLDDYLEIKKDRVEAKRTGDKRKDTFMKLMLNGFTGLMDSDVMWIYSPEEIITLRVYGQLIQLRVLEELTENGIRVISNNTDGTTAMVPRDKMDLYHKINNDISKEFKIGWEYSVIDRVVYTNVNNYICFISKEYMVDEEGKEINVKEKAKVKNKGFYKYGDDIPFGDSVNEQVVAKALTLFWRDGIAVEESIKNPEKYKFHIYDYCKSNKIDKTYDVVHNGEKVQNLNRYYFQRSGPLLFKRKKAASTLQNVNVGEGVAIFNKYEEKSWKEYDINYAHYIRKANKSINAILYKQLTLF